MKLYKEDLDFNLPSDMENLVSDRLHPVYRNLLAFKNNELWGWVPPNEEVFDFFESIAEYTSVSRILEFGYCLGYSSTYQLTVHPNATLDTYDVVNHFFNQNIYDTNGTFNLKLAYPGQAMDLGLLVWGNRLKIHLEKSFNAHSNHKQGEFDYVFIDGDHSIEGLLLDIEQAKILKIPFVVIDNVKQIKHISEVVEHNKEQGIFKEIKRMDYSTFYPGTPSRRPRSTYIPRRPHPDTIVFCELIDV